MQDAPPQNTTSLSRLRRDLARRTLNLRRAIGAAPPPPPPRIRPEPVGCVETIDKWGMQGWVDNQDGKSEIRIRLNGATIATTFPGRPVERDGEVRNIGFSRALKHIWRHLGEGDVLTVEYKNKPLPIEGHGMQWVYAASGESRARRVISRVKRGFVINKYGKLKKSIRQDEEYKAWVFETLEAMRGEIRERLGYEAFPIYGSMLGAVREQDFIGHDNDFDMMYVSRHTDRKLVQQEYHDLCSHLIDRGYWLKVKKTHTWVRKRGTWHKLDIFFGWFDGAGRLQISNGYHYDPVHRDTARIDRLEPYEMAGHTVMLPAGTEQILVQLYGPTWRTPDRGFRHKSPTLRVDPAYFLNVSRVLDLYWKQYYRDRRASPVSPFAQSLAERLEPGSTIVELGCGAGGDACFFASLGHEVEAVDRSPAAIELARAHQKELGQDGVAFSVFNAANPETLKAFFARKAKRQPPVVYLRFYLHAVSKATREALYQALKTLPADARVAMEFRTDVDAERYRGLPKRWPMSPDDVARRLERLGFQVEHREAGRGLSPRKNENPHLARIIARKIAPARTGFSLRPGQ